MYVLRVQYNQYFFLNLGYNMTMVRRQIFHNKTYKHIKNLKEICIDIRYLISHKTNKTYVSDILEYPDFTADYI